MLMMMVMLWMVEGVCDQLFVELKYGDHGSVCVGFVEGCVNRS